jgi:ribulose-5-phosphate 4-epimerase/fuculose-1-phosphate aldolase
MTTSNSYRETREALAAAHRMAVIDGLNEGTWNHFSALVPDRFDLMLVTPLDRHWRQVTASSLVLVDAEGNVCEGSGIFDPAAYFFHYPIHRSHPKAACVLHVHPPYATALAMVAGGRLRIADQNGAALYERIAYYDEYGSFVLDTEHGQRIALALGNKRVLFLRNHGVIVVGPTIADAYTDLYHLERACMFQCHAASMGGELALISKAVGRQTAVSAESVGYKATHFAAMQRLIEAEQPDYRN